MRLPLLLGAVSLLLLAPGVSAAGPKPRVWLADQTPARVAGSGFRAKERVAIVLTSGKVTLRKSVVTTATGRLQASWNTSIAGGCRPTWIAAIGAKGSRAVYREVANDCGPIPGKL